MSSYRNLTLGTAIVALAGCVSGTYTPPKPMEISNRLIVDQPFDKTWDNLISHASASFFGIENFEKDSGLLTLSFRAGDADSYIDCGSFAVSTAARTYNGSYVRWTEIENAGTLEGRMNLRVRPVSRNQTEVIVNARYVFSTPRQTTGSGATARTLPAVRWVFESRTQDTQSVPSPVPGTMTTRTCQSTGRAERDILDALEAMAG